ncbi:MAG: P-loop ATPase, Sll1717 family, partial [Stellaceae bacterium]
IRVYGEFRKYNNVSLKIFLREDIWNRIMEPGYREASHLVRCEILKWTNPSLLNLMMRRILDNRVLTEEFEIDRDSVLRDVTQQEALFEKLFPRQVEQGPQKATTFNWMVTRCADATKKTAPRELIHLLNSILEQEIKRLENGGKPDPDRKLFDRSVFKQALPTVSNARLTQYLYAEYPNQREFLEKMDGAKAEQTPDSLEKIWDLDRETAIAKANELVELGFFEARSTRSAPTYWVPFLYRDALHLVQGRAEADED